MQTNRFRYSVAAIGIVAGLGLAASTGLAGTFTNVLVPSDETGVPEQASHGAWLAATGEAVAVVDQPTHTVTVSAENLVPGGLYTVWYVEEQLIGMSAGPAGGVPDNEFRADATGTAEITFEVPADNAYDRLVVAYHADDQTHGESPGEMGTVTFEHLSGEWPAGGIITGQ